MKRIYIPYSCYHITTNPKERIPYFQEDEFIEILSYTIEECMQLKKSNLIGYKINPDHIHMIIQVRDLFNISEVIHSIKRVSSDRINQILAYSHDLSTYKNLIWSDKLVSLNEKFSLKYNKLKPHEYPLFRWQRGFDDQLIRSSNQLLSTINYLRIQHIKHNLSDNRGLKINESIPSDIKFINDKL